MSATATQEKLSRLTRDKIHLYFDANQEPAIEPIASGVFTCGSAMYWACFLGIRSTRTVTSDWHSIAAPEISPSPWTA